MRRIARNGLAALPLLVLAALAAAPARAESAPLSLSACSARYAAAAGTARQSWPDFSRQVCGSAAWPQAAVEFKEEPASRSRPWSLRPALRRPAHLRADPCQRRMHRPEVRRHHAGASSHGPTHHHRVHARPAPVHHYVMHRRPRGC